jgi:hypothetical protein
MTLQNNTLEQLIAEINAAGLKVHNLSQHQDGTWGALVWAYKAHHHDWGSGVTPIDALIRAFEAVKPHLPSSQPSDDGDDLI